MMEGIRMGWLSSLLKELIVIILLAAFVDLLLPNRSMQRYVKTVIGLFLVMVLLTPVFQLFQKGWDANRLVGEAIASLDESGAGANGLKMKSLQEIMAESNRLKQLNEKEAAKLAEGRASQAIRDGLLQAEGIAAKRVAAVVEPDSQGNMRLARVEVTLAQDGSGAGGATAAGVPGRQVGVEPVKPVSIRIVPEQARLKAGDAAEGGETAKRVRSYLQQQWQVQPENAAVTIETEP
jgi:stage III sporulation protein AF